MTQAKLATKKEIRAAAARTRKPCAYSKVGVYLDQYRNAELGRMVGEHDEEYETMGLFEVTLPGGTQVMVLAESPDGAIAQATDWEEDKAGCTANRVPVLVRGWGQQAF